MGLFSSILIWGSALTAQRLRMDVIAGNIANADTTRVNGQRQPYQRQQVVFEPLATKGSESAGLQVASIIKDEAPAREVYDPSHPDADPNTGLVAYPNVDTTTEMTDMLSASRGFSMALQVRNKLVDAYQEIMRMSV